MIIQCQSCSAKYFLPEEKVPAQPLKVRCPKCRAVFMLAGKAERANIVMPQVAPAPEVTAPDTGTMRGLVQSFMSRAGEPVAAPVAEATITPTAVEEPVLAAEPVVAQAPIPAAVEPEPAAVEPEPAIVPDPAPAAAPAGKNTARAGKSADDRAKRLARVLVSDILWYNRERRDAALRDGTLMTSLGEEIKKSWELYKEKVGPEAAHSTNYFKEALNEILANGQQVF
jgi:predicted Zn finger-like uncharacterized protein